MTNYFKIEKDSTLGVAFLALQKQCDEVREKIDILRAKYGFTDTYHYGQYAAGAISEVVFLESESLDLKKVWKKGKIAWNSYAPRMRGEGAKVYQEFKDCGSVTRFEFNELMNVNDVFHLIGYALNSNPKYIGVSANIKKMKSVPTDAIEITGSEYDKLFNSECDNDKD